VRAATGGARPTVSVHAGFAAYPTDGTYPEELVSTARAALRTARLATGRAIVAAPPRRDAAPAAPIAVDPQMLRVHDLVAKVADRTTTVLILGETGVGKELVATAIHQRSPRRGAAFVRLNCAALSETLLESELFGHEAGAFSGADRRKIGYCEAASGGTLFLDEIAELPTTCRGSCSASWSDARSRAWVGRARSPSTSESSVRPTAISTRRFAPVDSGTTCTSGSARSRSRFPRCGLGPPTWRRW